MAAITLDRLWKTFPTGAAAVRDLTLAVEDGELLVLVGPSGSGKSTVLRLIAGLDNPTGGRVLIGGQDVTALPPPDRDLAMVFQSYALYPHLTVFQNLAFGLRMRRTPPDEIDTRVRRAARTLGIDSLLGRKPAELSGGQRQRVALGRAIVREPHAFLLDEPLSNLDPALRVETRAELALLHRRLGTTIVYVTHDQEEAMTLGTRIAVMRDGRIEQVGAPLDVFTRPANTFVAGFVGSPAMNLLAPDVLPGIIGATVDDVLLGVRPHDVEITPVGEAMAVGRVQVIEPLGSTTLLHVLTEHGPPIRVVVGSDVTLHADDRVGVSVRRERVHVFDRATGVRRNRSPS